MLPDGGAAFVSVKDGDKPDDPARRARAGGAGFAIVATGGTARLPRARTASPVERINKVAQGRPHIVDRVTDGGIDLIFNTTEGWQSLKDSRPIRQSRWRGGSRTSPPPPHRSRRREAIAGEGGRAHLKYGRCNPIIRARTTDPTQSR